MTVSPISAGLRCVCPNCAQASVYQGYLTFKPACDVCGTDFTGADVGDGASFFVMFAAMAVIIPMALILEIIAGPPIWLHAIIWVPATFAFCLWLLRPAKALLFSLQWANNAKEAELDTGLD